MKKLSYLLLLFLLLGQTSCKKEKEKSVEEYLTQGTWYGESYKITKNGDVLDQGSLEGTIKYKDDGRYVKKNDIGNVVEEGDWQLLNDGDEIYFMPEVSGAYMVTIDRLDENNLKYHFYKLGKRFEFVFKQ